MIYKTRHFNRWARKVLLSDDLLHNAVEEMVSEGALLEVSYGQNK